MYLKCCNVYIILVCSRFIFFNTLQSPESTTASNNENQDQVPDDHEEVEEKRKIKERDGFCRRVDSYDGQVVRVDGKMMLIWIVVLFLRLFLNMLPFSCNLQRNRQTNV